MMRRRDVIAGLGAASMMVPIAARAQQKPKMLHLGFVHPVSPKDVGPGYVSFIGRLRELGYVEGETLVIEYINLEGHLERYDEAMRELVRRRVDLIYAQGQEENLRAAMAATSTIPIVMLALSYNPLTKGYVTSLARPTGNVTGIYVLEDEIAKKQLQIIKDALPEIRAVFGFWDFESAATWRTAVDVAPILGLTLEGVELRDSPYDYERAFQQVAPEFRGALLSVNSAAFTRDSQRIVAFTLRHRIPSIFDNSRVVDAGGLMSYGTDFDAANRHAAELADRIARGAKPADLPIEQSTRFKLRINLKTARTLGLTIPPSLLARADEVVE